MFASNVTRSAVIFVKWGVHIAGLDRASFYGGLGRVWNIAQSAVSLLLIARFFSLDVQGFHYTFMSLIALQVFAELGLGQVLIQYVSHEWIHLRLGGDGSVEGNDLAADRLAGLMHFAIRWFGTASLLFFLGAEVAGYIIFHHSNIHIGWIWQWTALCLAVVADLCLLPFFCVLDGTNQVISSYQIRFIRGISTGLALCIAIYFGGGLWSSAISLWAGVLSMGLMVLLRHQVFFVSLFRRDYSKSGWLTELWPMQWRIMLSWISGYLSFSLFTPVLFKFQGPMAAAQMGMTWSIIQSLSGITGTVVQTKVPLFGMLVAQRNWAELDRLAIRLSASSGVLLLFGGAVLLGGVYLLHLYQVPFARRLLPLTPLAIFLLASVVIQIMMPIAFYLRAHKREPLLAISLIIGFLTALSTLVLGYYFGAVGIAWGYLAITVLIALPGCLFVLMRFRQAWHT